MKRYVMSCLSFVAFTGVTDVFCIIFENTTDYPVELAFQIGKMNDTFKHDVYEDRVVIISPHSSLDEDTEGRLPIDRLGESLRILTVTLIKEGVKQPVDFKKYSDRIKFIDHVRSIKETYDYILSVVPWGNSYRLIRLLQ